MFSFRGEGQGEKNAKGKREGSVFACWTSYIMVGSSSGLNVKFPHKWSNFDLPKLMPEEYRHFLRCLHHGCFLLIHVSKLLFTAQPIRILRTPVSAEMNKRGFLWQASLTQAKCMRTDSCYYETSKIVHWEINQFVRKELYVFHHTCTLVVHCSINNQGGGGGGVINKVPLVQYTGRLRPQVRPLNKNGTPFVYLLLTNGTPSTYLL